jgi:hypothetical protein
VNAKQFHLTYAACYPNELDKKYLHERAEEWARQHGGLTEWSIGREDHKEPADPARDEHFHLYIRFGKPKDLANRFTTKVFDVISSFGNVRHPEIQAVGATALDREKVVRYTMKDGDFDCSDGLDYEFGRRKKELDARPTRLRRAQLPSACSTYSIRRAADHELRSVQMRRSAGAKRRQEPPAQR